MMLGICRAPTDNSLATTSKQYAATMKLLPTCRETTFHSHTHTHTLNIVYTSSMHTQLMIMADDDNSYPNKNMPGSSFGPPHETGFEISDFFELGNWIEDDPPPAFSSPSVGGYNPQNPSYTPSEIGVNSSGISSSYHEGSINRDSGSSRERKEIREKVAFKTKSEVEVLDDGFKWRKYGKKMVKNSPNPRNYYRCSVEGCQVKKRVERDKDDPNYVVTTYEGIHNHQGPQQ